MAELKSEIELQCPCCHAMIVVDINLGRIMLHQAPERGDKPELNEATRILAEEARRREALFEQSIEAEKTRGDALSRRFEEALRQAKDEPVTKPMSDFDLDLTIALAPPCRKISGERRPAFAPRIPLPRFVPMRFAEGAVPDAPPVGTLVRRPDPAVRPVEQQPFHLPHVRV